MTDPNVVTSISEMIREIAAGIRAWIAGADVRKMKAAIEYGEQYIFTNERNDLDKTTKDRLLLNIRTKFFKYN